MNRLGRRGITGGAHAARAEGEKSLCPTGKKFGRGSAIEEERNNLEESSTLEKVNRSKP